MHSPVKLEFWCVRLLLDCEFLRDRDGATLYFIRIAPRPCIVHGIFGALSKYLLKWTENCVRVDVYTCSLGYQRKQLLKQDLNWKIKLVLCWLNISL